MAVIINILYYFDTDYADTVQNIFQVLQNLTNQQ